MRFFFFSFLLVWIFSELITKHSFGSKGAAMQPDMHIKIPSPITKYLSWTNINSLQTCTLKTQMDANILNILAYFSIFRTKYLSKRKIYANLIQMKGNQQSKLARSLKEGDSNLPNSKLWPKWIVWSIKCTHAEISSSCQRQLEFMTKLHKV